MQAQGLGDRSGGQKRVWLSVSANEARPSPRRDAAPALLALFRPARHNCSFATADYCALQRQRHHHQPTCTHVAPACRRSAKREEFENEKFSSLLFLCFGLRFRFLIPPILGFWGCVRCCSFWLGGTALHDATCASFFLFSSFFFLLRSSTRREMDVGNLNVLFFLAWGSGVVQRIAGAAAFRCTPHSEKSRNDTHAIAESCDYTSGRWHEKNRCASCHFAIVW
ncbi:hypothetical protein HDV63DRAFT_266188 [Trichoderma sp. SZMC 28014]